ncbi:MAG: hypothetical protein LC130_27990 [Bryobacterales bacterium]|nr:hypothetical protein [Bryobacterales bacterium]
MREPMDSPFFSQRQTAGFALVLLFFLALPLILAKSGALSRRDVYETVPVKWGSFPYIHQQIFEKTSDIDLLFLGTSLLWEAIDTPHVQREMTKRLGREANVISLGTNWRCEQLNYMLLRDILERRKVRMVVLSMPIFRQKDELPHVQSYRWLLYGEDEPSLHGLPARNRLTSYAGNVLGAPRHLLSLVRPDHADSAPYELTLGSRQVQRGIGNSPFTRWTPKPPDIPVRDMIYSEQTRGRFHFTGQVLNPFQMHFLKLTFELLRRHEVKTVLLNIPVWTDRESTRAIERMPWPGLFGKDITLIGIPPASLFQGMSPDEVDRLFYNDYDWPNHHFNQNGNEFFTRVIAPALVETASR